MANWRTNEFLFKAKLLIENAGECNNTLLQHSINVQSARYLQLSLHSVLMEVFENNFLVLPSELSFSELMQLNEPIQELNVVQQLFDGGNSWLCYLLDLVSEENNLQKSNSSQINAANASLLASDKKEWALPECYNECLQLIESFRQTSLSW
jgi:hypothetical protein